MERKGPGCCLQIIKEDIIYRERDTPDAIVMYNFWREHSLILVNPN